MKIEVWKPIDFIEGLKGSYEVSSLGRVRNTETYYILKGEINPYGYRTVGLRINNKLKHRFVHRLVAMAFLDNPQNYTIVNHKNEIRNDNRLENLEWCDAKYNVNYFFNNHPDRKEDYRKNFTKEDGTHICPLGARTRFEPIALINERYEILEIFKDSTEAGRKIGDKSDAVYKTCERNEFQGKYKKKEFCVCRGYIFFFLDSKRLSQFKRNRELIFSYKNTHLCEKQDIARQSKMTKKSVAIERG